MCPEGSQVEAKYLARRKRQQKMFTSRRLSKGNWRSLHVRHHLFWSLELDKSTFDLYAVKLIYELTNASDLLMTCNQPTLLVVGNFDAIDDETQFIDFLTSSTRNEMNKPIQAEIG